MIPANVAVTFAFIPLLFHYRAIFGTGHGIVVDKVQFLALFLASLILLNSRQRIQAFMLRLNAAKHQIIALLAGGMQSHCLRDVLSHCAGKATGNAATSERAKETPDRMHNKLHMYRPNIGRRFSEN